MSSASTLIAMERRLMEISRQIIELQEERERIVGSRHATPCTPASWTFWGGYGKQGPVIREVSVVDEGQPGGDHTVEATFERREDGGLAVTDVEIIPNSDPFGGEE